MTAESRRRSHRQCCECRRRGGDSPSFIAHAPRLSDAALLPHLDHACEGLHAGLPLGYHRHLPLHTHVGPGTTTQVSEENVTDSTYVRKMFYIMLWGLYWEIWSNKVNVEALVAQSVLVCDSQTRLQYCALLRDNIKDISNGNFFLPRSLRSDAKQKILLS